MQQRDPQTVCQLLAQMRVTGKSAFLVWCQRISWSWNCEQLWSVPRYQSTLDNSELQNCASPRFWIAAWNTEYHGYLRKRLWTTTCSRRTYSKYLRTEFGTFFSWSETKTYRTHDDNRIEDETWATRPIQFEKHSPLWRWNFTSDWWNLFSRWYDAIPEISNLGTASCKIPWLH